MKVLGSILLVILVLVGSCTGNTNDDEYDFEEEESTPQTEQQEPEEKDDVVPAKQGFDEDEFVSSAGGSTGGEDTSDNSEKTTHTNTKQKIPDHFLPPKPFAWTDYGLEFIYITIISCYACFFFYGRWKNQQIATTWGQQYSQHFDNNFAKVGGDTRFLVDGNYVFVMRASGRIHTVGMQAVLELKKRHDIFYYFYQQFRGIRDKVTLDIVLEKMDPFVFALIRSKIAKDYKQNHSDLISYSKPRDIATLYDSNNNNSNNNNDSDIMSKFVLHTESGDIAQVVLPERIMDVLESCSNLLECIHITDQYPSKSHKQILRVVFYLPSTPEEVEQHKTLINTSFYLIDHIASIAIASEAKKKAIERRQKAQIQQQVKEKEEERKEQQQKKQEEKKKKEEERLKKMTPDQLAKEEARLRKKEMRKASKMKVVFG